MTTRLIDPTIAKIHEKVLDVLDTIFLLCHNDTGGRFIVKLKKKASEGDEISQELVDRWPADGFDAQNAQFWFQKILHLNVTMKVSEKKSFFKLTTKSVKEPMFLSVANPMLEHIKSEYTVENWLFVTDVLNKLCAETDNVPVYMVSLRMLYRTYIKVGSELEVNISGSLRKSFAEWYKLTNNYAIPKENTRKTKKTTKKNEDANTTTKKIKGKKTTSEKKNKVDEDTNTTTKKIKDKKTTNEKKNKVVAKTKTKSTDTAGKKKKKSSNDN